MKFFAFIVICSVVSSCSINNKEQIFTAKLSINDSVGIPFTLVYNANTESYYVKNGAEIIEDLNLSEVNDSINLEHKAFNSVLRFKHLNDTISGIWYNLEKGSYKMPFQAVRNSLRFNSVQSKTDASGRWQSEFGRPSEVYPAIGIFTQDEQRLQGTFLTETGDYRYLEGVVSADSILLSTFDFAHAFLFKAKVTNQFMSGVFYSGNHWNEPFKAWKNANAQLAEASTLISVNDSITDQFAFNGLSGEEITIDHALFKNKAIVIQLFGSWCPNCYDESLFLNALYKEISRNSIEFIGVGFERQSGFELSKTKIEKFKSALNLQYPMAYGGPSNKDSAQKVFPFLDKVISFPTLLFYDSNHQFMGSHSGFSGPGTGHEYFNTKEILEKKIKSLILE